MRFRLGGFLAFAAILTALSGACNTAGVAYVYMALDGGGTQPRGQFYTDTNSIFAIVVFSAARPDATLDLVIHQTGVYSWCNMGELSNDPADVHPNFANAEITPGKSIDKIVSAELPQSGLPVSELCQNPGDQCEPNTDAVTKCQGSVMPPAAISCPPGLMSAGNDSCAPGYQCCVPPVGTIESANAATTAVSSIPYPAGVYNLVVSLDGIQVGEPVPFTITYPPGPTGAQCPVAAPYDGVTCYQWVPLATQCPGYEGSQQCECESTGLWSCVTM